jgi:hypothetical protein
MERYLTIFPGDRKNYCFMSEKMEQEFEKDSFREMGKLLKKEENHLLDIIFDVSHSVAGTTGMDLDLSDLDSLKTGYQKISLGIVCPLEFVSQNENVSENINQVNFIVQFKGTSTRPNLVVLSKAPNASRGLECENDVLMMLSDLISLTKVHLNSDGSVSEESPLLSFSFAYLLLESHFNGKKIVFDTQSNSLYFEMINEYLLKYQTNKFSKFWADIFDHTTCSIALKFSNLGCTYDMYQKHIHCRERIITERKTIPNPIYLGELIFTIYCDDGNISLWPTVALPPSRLRYSLDDISRTKFSLNMQFYLENETYSTLTIPAILLYSRDFISLKRFFVRHIQNTNVLETKETLERTEVHDYFKLDHFMDCVMDLDFYIIPFCSNFSSYENCLNFFKEERGIYKMEDVSGLHLRRDCRIVFDFEFYSEIRDDIFIHILNRESWVM